MFVYTVYGLPGISRRQPARRVSPVSEVEPALSVRPGWMVGMPGSQRPYRGLETQKAARGYLQALGQAAAEPVGEEPPASAAEPAVAKTPEAFFLVNAQALVVGHRQARPPKEPDFAGSLERLRQA